MPAASTRQRSKKAATKDSSNAKAQQTTVKQHSDSSDTGGGGGGSSNDPNDVRHLYPPLYPVESSLDCSTARVLRKPVVLALVTWAVSAAIYMAMGYSTGGNSSAPVQVHNPHGFQTAVIWLELASSSSDVLGAIGKEGTGQGDTMRAHMLAGTRWDFVFAVAYTVHHVALLGLVTRLLATRGKEFPKGMAGFKTCLFLSYVACFADVLENMQLLRLLSLPVDRIPTTLYVILPLLARAKFLSIFIVATILGVAYLRYMDPLPARWSWRAIPKTLGNVRLLLPTLFLCCGVLGGTGALIMRLRVLIEVGAALLGAGYMAAMAHCIYLAYHMLLQGRPQDQQSPQPVPPSSSSS